MDINIIQNKFWNRIASTTEISDQFYLPKLAAYINPESLIIDYGCGYGRILDYLYRNNFQNTLGFDLSQGMINRGKKEFPFLNIQTINHANIPLSDNIVDAAILSMVLCCIPENQKQEEIIQEIYRVLKPGAPLYLIDFLITDTERMIKLYQRDFQLSNTWGTFQTTEGFSIRHFTDDHIEKLLNHFEVQWSQEEWGADMDELPLKTYHCIYTKK